MTLKDQMVDCWNCGRNYNSDEHEACPSCGEYASNDPSLITEEVEEPDYDDEDADIDVFLDEDY